MPRESTGRHAFLVSAGILISRLVGLLRQRVFNFYFGLADEADAFNAALRIPNFLQNLFGEGSLSASFIPVYTRLLREPDSEEADHVAGAIGALLALGSATLVLIGMIATPWLMWAIAPGYHGPKRDLIILLVRILFPGTGLLVCSAWCLGILNSHRKFFLSYSAPVVWNAALIATILIFRHHDLTTLAIRLAWGTVAGCALQFGIQVPAVLRVTRRLRPKLDTASPHVRTVMHQFVPVALSRGVMQVSAYIDQAISSWLGEGALSGMTTAQSIYMLPVSLFGIAISAAELPAMSTASTEGDGLRLRLNSGLRRIAFFIVPSAMAFFVFGDVISAALYLGGRFTRANAVYVWAILAGAGIGLLASTLGRLYQSTYYALRDTRTPLRFAIIRVILTGALGYLFALPLPKLIGIHQQWGAAGLTASAGIAGWVEFSLLRRTLNARIGATGVPALLVVKLWASAGVGAAGGWAVKLVLGPKGAVIDAILILGTFGLLYFAATYLAGVEEWRDFAGRLVRLQRRFKN